ncbi:MAG: CDC27 family protein [bacterium]
MIITKRTIAVLAILLTGGLIVVSTTFAAGSSSQRPARKSDYDKAVSAVKAGNYRTAIALLEKVVARDSRHADGYNYLAFSHRKLGQFDIAMKFYRKALAINPKHKGAHEYIGELYLQLGNLKQARAHLARLDSICWLGCSEYTDLKAAIKRYEAGKGG